jgi:anti-sigma regulatory factor (Ser/Thr protein kinase)
VQFGSTPREWEEWTVYEAILNRALAHHPAWVVCPYDSRTLPAPVVERAAQTHPELLADGWRDSAQYDDPARLAQALAPEPEPVRELQAVPIDANLCTQRDQLAEALTAAGAPPPRVQDMLAAAGEVLANAAHHADGARTIRVGAVGDRFVCEISDSGRGHDDPLAGYLPPGADTTDGAGLWVARQVSSSLDLISSAEGLTVRIWV